MPLVLTQSAAGRNDANPKLPDPLKTEQVGKRSLIGLEEARRWLAGRKGFIPTKTCEGTAQRPPEWDVELTEGQVEKIGKEAQKAGLSFNAHMKKQMIKAFEGMNTAHAKIRSQQRGIPPIVVDMLLQFGHREHDHAGAEIVHFDRRSKKKIESYTGGLIGKLSELFG